MFTSRFIWPRLFATFQGKRRCLVLFQLCVYVSFLNPIAISNILYGVGEPHPKKRTTSSRQNPTHNTGFHYDYCKHEEKKNEEEKVVLFKRFFTSSSSCLDFSAYISRR